MDTEAQAVTKETAPQPSVCDKEGGCGCVLGRGGSCHLGSRWTEEGWWAGGAHKRILGLGGLWCCLLPSPESGGGVEGVPMDSQTAFFPSEPLRRGSYPALLTDPLEVCPLSPVTGGHPGNRPCTQQGSLDFPQAPSLSHVGRNCSAHGRSGQMVMRVCVGPLFSRGPLSAPCQTGPVTAEQL